MEAQIEFRGLSFSFSRFVQREKPIYCSCDCNFLCQVTELQVVVGQINEAFAPGPAEGVQLEALAASLSLSRLDTSAGAIVTDEVFRDFIQNKLVQWSWDGTNKPVPEVVTKIQPGAVETDNQNGTVTVTGASGLPAPVKELFPISAGVRTT